ncbi:hypothetical protein [Bosea sp. 685]|uniref:hypothetical protein n=1 Tax=Bosea sp. 685 TaxID=3080057 RepID=UPI002892E3D3|nr:hypothetical protein [Bosea sp. 685]WNJ88952.1 hypothetical protein RMR04_21395 [Bosea sp. 685]
MFRTFAGLSTLAIGAAALAVASFAPITSASAFDGRYERGYERAEYGWRPAPPVFHGYWGRRHWRHQYEGQGFRAPPPAYGYGWR